MRSPYAGYDVLAKWRSPSFDAPTRDVLAKRLEPPPRRFFSVAEFRLIGAVADRLIPQPDRTQPIPLAALIDDYFAEGRGGGYRIDGHPHLDEAWRIGLAGIDAEARARFGSGFADLAPVDQDAVLRAIQAGDIERGAWRGLDPAQFFQNTLLKLTAGLYYAHPAAWSEIGFGGPASPRGYVRVGLDDRDPWEAVETPP
jgi:hypothetical protein